MKVRCTKLIDSGGTPQGTSTWLTLGKIYHVLSVVLDIHATWYLRLRGDVEHGVGLFPLTQFEIVSARIPRLWTITWNNGVFELTTEQWARPNFWERFYEHDVDAVRIFDRESMKIIDDDP
jgi:hypothetical protein